ncbi:long-chain fatty acid--CoA ligase, partial [Candidatus Acetothermia bacterium]|nr:long-chain fatty acid--CoA ligase [Candidatus Acetothermia bacterium]
PLFHLLDEGAKKHGARTALIFFGKKISYSELHQLVEHFASGLTRLGLQKGDRISIMLPNMPQFVIAFYAALKVGATVVQTNPLYTEHELEEILKDSGAQTLITLDRFYPKVRHVREKLKLKNLILSRVEDFLPLAKKILLRLKWKITREPILTMPSEPEAYDFMKLLSEPASPRPTISINPREDVALLQYTGGTTGTPKGAMLTHTNLMANAMQNRAWFPRAREGKETVLAVAPFFHVYGMTIAMNLPLSYGSTLVLIPRFDIDELLKAIDRYKPTIFPGVPTLYIAINHHPKAREYDLSSLRECISGSAPLLVDVRERFEQLTGATLVEGYGLSEASPVTHSNLLDGKQVEGSIGIPLPNTDAMILNLETGKPATIGESGELLVRGPQIMKGYWNKPEATQATITPDGWLRTGDIATMNEDGYFFIVDRLKDMINCSGLKVYPREVEEILHQHPKIREAAVLGVPDSYRGETVKAVIVPQPNETLTEREITEFCAQQLAKYKIPKLIEFRTELPKSAVGKILKQNLK